MNRKQEAIHEEIDYFVVFITIMLIAFHVLYRISYQNVSMWKILAAMYCVVNIWSLYLDYKRDIRYRHECGMFSLILLVAFYVTQRQLLSKLTVTIFILVNLYALVADYIGCDRYRRYYHLAAMLIIALPLKELIFPLEMGIYCGFNSYFLLTDYAEERKHKKQFYLIYAIVQAFFFLTILFFSGKRGFIAL